MPVVKNNFKHQPQVDIPEMKGFVKLVKVEHNCKEKAQDMLDTITSCLKLNLDKPLRSLLASANGAKIYVLFTDNSKINIENGVIQDAS